MKFICFNTQQVYMMGDVETTVTYETQGMTRKGETYTIGTFNTEAEAREMTAALYAPLIQLRKVLGVVEELKEGGVMMTDPQMCDQEDNLYEMEYGALWAAYKEAMEVISDTREG
jgi:hypothetical protein|tara:strand:- start:1532 stop:1876 length:345 start_codon:yes stop_codon:yes gene_type:complete